MYGAGLLGRRWDRLAAAGALDTAAADPIVVR
jgi:hypothetical protein